VGRTSVEAVVGENSAAVGEAAVVEAWRWMWRSGHMRRGPNNGR
jgi:hypothetical protein